MLSGSVHTWDDRECSIYYPIMKDIVCAILIHIKELKELEITIKKIKKPNT